MVPVAVMLRDLVRRGLIQEVEKGKWMRTQMTPPTPTDTKGVKVPFRKKHGELPYKGLYTSDACAQEGTGSNKCSVIDLSYKRNGHSVRFVSSEETYKTVHESKLKSFCYIFLSQTNAI